MLFHTIEGVTLILVLWILTSLVRNPWDQIVLLAGSYLFYAWFSVPWLSLLIFSTVVDFWFGNRIHAAKNQRLKSILLTCSLAISLGLLGYFKYSFFLSESINDIIQWSSGERPFPEKRIFLPLGISFYTFQTMSYIIDIYRGRIEPEPSLRRFALFVTFFPHLVAGPIVIAKKFLPQLYKKPSICFDSVTSGMLLFSSGILKKMLIADNLALIVDPVFSRPSAFGSFEVLCAAYAFAFQIYADFSGYTDMARGIARCFGYDLGLNFNSPYLAMGIRDFWKRWHISLSNWLRDYLYIPLGGNQISPLRTDLNVGITMLLGGLWHGANWTFIVWGSLHAFAIIAERRLQHIVRRYNISSWLSPVLTFHFVTFCWIFFRAENLSTAFQFIQRIVDLDPQGSTLHCSLPLKNILIIIPLMAIERSQEHSNIFNKALESTLFQWILIGLCLLTTLIFSRFGGGDFVYFNF